MKTNAITMWGIHTKDDMLFLNNSIIGIGWKDMENIGELPDDIEAFKNKYKEKYPESKKGAIPVAANMLHKFVYEMKIGDYIVYPSKINREINIGVVESEYMYKPDSIYPQQRSVKWIKHLSRLSFSQSALYEVGSIMTLFKVKKNCDEFLSALSGKIMHTSAISDDNSEDNNITADELSEQTKDFILKTLSKTLKGYDLEPFVADLLKAMGYRKPDVSKKGGDSGVDIVVYKDELPPRILVQVKSGDGDITEAILQAFKGAMQPSDYGLFVTLSNYKPKAKDYLAAHPEIRGINGTELVELILKYYEDLSPEYKKLIPLKKVYLPDITDSEIQSDI